MPLQDIDEIIGYANGDGTFSVELHCWGIKEGEKVPIVMKTPKARINVTAFATMDNVLWSIEAHETYK